MKKYNMVVPLAGRGSRMVAAGFKQPKPLIWAGDRQIIDWSMASVDHSDCNLIFIVRMDHVHNWSIDDALRRKYGEDIKIVVTDQETGGAADSCLLAKDLIDNDKPIIVYCPDIYFEPKFVPDDKVFEDDGCILTFKANSANYSYVEKGKDGYAVRTAEKIVISEDASVGVYCFKTGKQFVALAKAGVSGKESYICPLYNLLIAGGGRVSIKSVPTLYVMGTPEEHSFFEKVIFPYFLNRVFILCSDHSGFKAKEEMRKVLADWFDGVIDVGCFSGNDCDYADFISQAVSLKTHHPGAIILGFCRSGQGVNICANKYPGIRAAICPDAETASLAIRHNAANFISIPAGKVDVHTLRGIGQVLITEMFEGGRHQNRLQKLGDIWMS